MTLAPIGAGAPVRMTLDWDPQQEAYLVAAGATEYRIPVGPEPGGLRIDGRIGEGPWHPLLRGAGMLAPEEGAAPGAAAEGEPPESREWRHQAKGRILTLRAADQPGRHPTGPGMEIRVTGRSLEIAVSAPAAPAGAGFSGFALGTVGPDERRAVPAAGLPDPLWRLPDGTFLCAYPDRFLGAATSYSPGAAHYRPDTTGERCAIDETFYLTLSEDPLEPLPALRRPPAPFRVALEGRVTLDYYSEASYEDDARFLALLRFYGLQDILLVYRNWQHFGYRQGEPLLYPADRHRGSNDSFRRLVEQARDAGWLVALREEFARVAPDSSYWSETAVARAPDASPRTAWRGAQHAVAADRMLEFARLEATKIHRNYRPTAVFVDGHTAWNPESGLQQVSAGAGSRAATEADAIRRLAELLTYLRELHEGPVVGAAGEGAARFDTFAAGLAEGAIRGPEGGRSAPLVVDYELREVRPRLVGVGAGCYGRFHGLPADTPVDAGRLDTDAYRATEIALAHSGYLANFGLRPEGRGIAFPAGGAAAAAREYYLLRALQEMYLAAYPRTILYACGDRMLSLAEALAEGADLANARLQIEYASGLMVWVNRTAGEEWTVTAGDAAYTLPPCGWLAALPRQKFLAYSALVDGRRTDFCRAPEYAFVDVRGGEPRTVEGITTDGSAALVRGELPARRDVVMVGARVLLVDDREYRCSDRADLRISHLAGRELEVTVMDTASSRPVQLSWSPSPGVAVEAGARVREREGESWVESRSQVQAGGAGLQLTRARPGVTYRIGGPA